ncbi:hypothetical protein PAXINDRAFT_182290, partial [Paxillus involutus ATCC 200175]
MNRSILRQGLRGFEGEIKSPVGVSSNHTTEREYLSEHAYDDLQDSKTPSIHRVGVVSPSQYESGSDSAEEYDDPETAFASHQGTSGSGVASASATPPLQPSSPIQEDPSEAASNRAWYELDISVVLALVSPIGNWLTGGDHVKNVFLILLLIFYLHQVIEVPWSLYLMSRPRRAARTAPQ